MLIGRKELCKLFGVAVVAGCAVFVCTLFCSYMLDLVAIEGEISTAAERALYEAQRASGKVVCFVSGGCLSLTSAVLLLFYVKNYISTHGKELGICKAMGYRDGEIAVRFCVFGVSVFIGCAAGFALACAYMPFFYGLSGKSVALPAVPLRFHPTLAVFFVVLPALAFAGLSVLYALFGLKKPVLDLIRERSASRGVYRGKEEKTQTSFLRGLTKTVLRSKKSLVFFVAFSAFCFSAMTQMSFSMQDLSSREMGGMILSIGLILAVVTLCLSLSEVVRGNAKTVAMMKVFGYRDGECRRAIFGGYLPFALLGFALGSVYQWALLKIMVTVVFSDVVGVPEYAFDFPVMVLSLAAFAVAYGGLLFAYARRIRRTSLKSVMQET